MQTFLCISAVFQMNKAFIIARAIFYALMFIGLWIWLASLVQRYDPLFGFTLPPWLSPVGWVLIFIGLTVAGSCVSVFATRGEGTPAPFDPPQKFVANGPYRYVRNPMYLGALCALIGGGLMTQSISVLLLALAAFILVNVFILVYEEPSLQQRFGDSYSEYCRRINRWIPKLRG